MKKPIPRIAALVGTSIAWREQVMRGVASFAHEHGPWHVYTAPEGFENSMFFSRDYRWDGIIARVSERALAKQIYQLGVPAVNISATHVKGVDLPRANVDENALAGVAARHLLAAGFKRFAYCGNLKTPEGRGTAFARIVSAQGLSCQMYKAPAKAVPWQKWQRDLVKWVKSLSLPVGVFTWNADVGCQLVEACNRAGLRVPEDVAVLAGDDDRVKCDLSAPTVSAIEVPMERVGYEAAALLSRLMSGHRQPRGPVLVEPSGVLTIRQSTDTSHLPDRDVHLAMEFIRENAAGPLSVAKIAKNLMVSRRWLERHFMRVLGQSPHEAIQQARIDSAKRLLLETNWQSEKIAQATGYRTASYLTRAFRAATGLTPGAFRSRYRIEP